MLKPLLAVCLLLPLFTRTAAAGAIAPCPDCSIILVSIDTLTPGRLGCYGASRKITSPNLDAAAARGALFENLTVQSHLTPISMASVFTSLYPHRSGYINFLSEVPDNISSLPEIMRAFGYRTAAFSSSPEFSTFFWNSQHLEPFFEKGFDMIREPQVTRRTDLPAIKTWLRANKASKFFLWVAAGDVHCPYAVHADSATAALFGVTPYSGPIKSMKKWTGPGRVYRGVYYKQGTDTGDRPAPVPLAAGDLEHIVNMYDAGVYTFDRLFGELTAEIERLGLGGRTLLIVHSVHSDELGGRGYYGHWDVYKGEMRGALLVKGPGIPAGARLKGQVSGLDITPTVLDFAGIPPSYQAQGRSLLPVIAGKVTSTEKYIFSVRRPFFEKQWFPSLPPDVRGVYVKALEDASLEGWDASRFDVAVTAGDWRLIHRNSAKFTPQISWWNFLSGLKTPEPPEYELYNTAADPGETVNLAGANGKKMRELAGKIEEFEREANTDSLKSLALNPVGVQPYP